MELSQEQITEIAAKLGSQLAQQTAQAAPGQPAGFAPGGFGAQPMAVAPTMLSLRVKIPMQNGETGAYLMFPLPEGATPQVVQSMAQAAEAMFPIETFRPRENRGWSDNNSGGYGRGGYRNNRRW